MFHHSNICQEAKDRLAALDMDSPAEGQFTLEDGSHLATHYFEARDLEDVAQALHIVMVIRYLDDKGEAESIGVHLLSAPHEYSRFAFSQRTVGLMGVNLMMALMHWVYVGGLFDEDGPSTADSPGLDKDLRDYIEQQIIPLEWKSEFATDIALQTRVGILSRQTVSA